MLSLGAFSLFLLALGLDALPTSILAKTAAVNNSGQLGGFALHFRESVTHDRGTYLMVCALFLIAYARSAPIHESVCSRSSRR